ncbi:MAG TPA: hypothetical protein VFY49_04390 [Myxococcota bacterium]|nr:hypothetical protein [Myxococcota bacterium]
MAVRRSPRGISSPVSSGAGSTCWRAAAMLQPHQGQKRASRGISRRHAAHSGRSGVPQLAQKAAAGRAASPHERQQVGRSS